MNNKCARNDEFPENGDAAMVVFFFFPSLFFFGSISQVTPPSIPDTIARMELSGESTLTSLTSSVGWKDTFVDDVGLDLKSSKYDIRRISRLGNINFSTIQPLISVVEFDYFKQFRSSLFLVSPIRRDMKYHRLDRLRNRYSPFHFGFSSFMDLYKRCHTLLRPIVKRVTLLAVYRVARRCLDRCCEEKAAVFIRRYIALANGRVSWKQSCLSFSLFLLAIETPSRIQSSNTKRLINDKIREEKYVRAASSYVGSLIVDRRVWHGHKSWGNTDGNERVIKRDRRTPTMIS